MVKEGHMLHLLYPVISISISMFDIKERMVSLDFFLLSKMPMRPHVLSVTRTHESCLYKLEQFTFSDDTECPTCIEFHCSTWTSSLVYILKFFGYQSTLIYSLWTCAHFVYSYILHQIIKQKHTLITLLSGSMLVFFVGHEGEASLVKSSRVARVEEEKKHEC
jgi:hypothetical protein